MRGLRRKGRANNEPKVAENGGDARLKGVGECVRRQMEAKDSGFRPQDELLAEPVVSTEVGD